jgi:hypothetical protein
VPYAGGGVQLTTLEPERGASSFRIYKTEDPDEAEHLDSLGGTLPLDFDFEKSLWELQGPRALTE